MYAVVWLLVTVIDLYRWALIIYVAIGLGVAFNILNAYQPLVRKVTYALGQIIEPVLRPIRNAIPPLGGIDISPLILLLALGFLERLIIGL